MTTQILANSEKNFVINIVDETSPFTLDMSALAGPSSKFGPVTTLRLDQIKYSTDANIELAWDATANVPFYNLAAGQEDFDFRDTGGINNPKTTGFTGDVILTTTSTNFTTTLYFTKKFD